MIPFFSAAAYTSELENDYIAAFKRFLRSGRFILGPEVESFEVEFADWCGTSFAVGVGSGTEAITVALMSLGIGPGDEVITVSHTAVPTVSAILACGAMPVLVEIEPKYYTMDPESLRAAISKRTKAIIPVHLYGQPAEINDILDIVGNHQIPVVEDCAQAHGTLYRGRKVGTIGKFGCFSFYPTKNLGAFGDAGMLVTDDEELANRARSIRNLGQVDRYRHKYHGLNCRLDELHAALLRIKLPYLDSWVEQRRRAAGVYNKRLAVLADVAPVERMDCRHSYHLYVLRTPQRDALLHHLKLRGIEALIHYPIPVHLQEGYRKRVRPAGELHLTETTANEIISLPLYPGISQEMLETVATAVLEFNATD